MIAVADQCAGRRTSIKPVAWTVLDAAGRSSIGGWQDMATYRAEAHAGQLAAGHTVAFSISRADHESELNRIRGYEVDPLLAKQAELKEELARLRGVVNELTECLVDVYHERGGWAVEEVITMGHQAAQGEFK